MRIGITILLTIIYAVVVFSTGSFAQKPAKVQKKTLVEKAFEVFPPSLSSSVPGVVESTIYNVILLKKYYPGENYSKFINRLNEIAEESADPGLRYKAHLASVYLNFSEMIDVQPQKHVYDREYLFRQISSQLENKLAVQ